MKILNFIIPVLCITLLSCSDSHDEPTIDQLSPFAKQYIGMQFGNSAYSSSGRDNTAGLANQSFQLLHNAATFAGGRNGEAGDSVIYNDPWQWHSCATTTITENADKSTTVTTDYGAGCLEGVAPYRYWRYGKHSSTTRNSLDKEGSVFTHSYTSSWIQDNFGGAYYWDGDTTTWNSDGYGRYEGNSVYDTVAHTYTGSYSMEYDNTYMWDDVVYRNTGGSVTSYSNSHYTVEERDDTYVQGENYYRSTVLTPLVSRWDCSQSRSSELGIAYCWMPSFVSGRDFIRYKQDGKEGSFIIDYGDGSCDNEITITENEITVRVDLGNNSTIARLFSK